jgi:hypothetical protein
LGNIFVHITDVKNKKKGKYPNRNKWIQFYAKYDPKHSSLRAVDIILIDKPLTNDSSDTPGTSTQLNGNIDSVKLNGAQKTQGKALHRKEQPHASSKTRSHKFRNHYKNGANSSKTQPS